METEEFDEIFKSAAGKIEGSGKADPERLEKLWGAIVAKQQHKRPIAKYLLVAAVLFLLLNSAYFMTAFFQLKDQSREFKATTHEDQLKLQELSNRLALRKSVLERKLDSLSKSLQQGVYGKKQDTVVKVEYVYLEKVVYRGTDKEERQLTLKNDSIKNNMKHPPQPPVDENKPENKNDEQESDQYLSNASIAMEGPGSRELPPAQKPASVKFNISLFKH